MLIIESVEKGKIADELKIKKGDKLVAFDGFDVVDLLDYLYYDEQESFIMTVEIDGELVDFEVEKYLGESLGLEFYNDNLDIKTCQNDCIFCFIKQMPKGLRQSLYVKDDDYRQSFLCGNYVTLTNITKDDLQRIIRLKLSPLYVSVHATDGEIRKKMLRNRFADKINNYLKAFSDAGIVVNTQIVLVKGVNDGIILEKTCNDLKGFSCVNSIAVVPCGITKYREGLFPVLDFDKKDAKLVIEQIDIINKNSGVKISVADEFYIKAGLYPNGEYGDYAQIENGVGMFSLFENEFNSVLEKRSLNKTFLIVTGVSAYELIKRFAEKTMQYVKNLKVDVVKAENSYFGNTVTCAGLITAFDIEKRLSNYTDYYDELVISRVMLRETEDVFLDGTTVMELSNKINKPIRIVRGGGDAFFNTLTKEKYE